MTDVLAREAGEPMEDQEDTPGSGSFDAFYAREQRAVVALAYVLCGSAATAEELAQDAFLEAMRAWDRVGRMDAPGAWVRRVVANRSMSRFRRLRAESTALLRAGRNPMAPAAADGDGDAEAVWAEVRALPRRQAQAIALRYLHDLSRREVARVLGCSEETVKTHLERARRTLAERLGEAWQEER